jgi:hypothetical protein
MSRFLLLAVLLLLANCPAALCQSRVELGVFVDYLNVSQTNTNNYGLGARVGIRAHRNLMLEGEFAYDYGINVDETYHNLVTGNIAAIENTSIGVTQGLFGPTLIRASHRLRPFAMLKVGFTDFRFSTSLLPYSNIASSLLGLRTSSLNFALYPAAGLEASLGPVGLRLEIGDEAYFNHGGHNNFRLTFGPVIRF